MLFNQIARIVISYAAHRAFNRLISFSKKKSSCNQCNPGPDIVHDPEFYFIENSHTRIELQLAAAQMISFSEIHRLLAKFYKRLVFWISWLIA
jgi:hypothetical protein